MSKLNINFNNSEYSIKESALASAKDSLKTHLSSVMNGSGGGNTITWDGVVGDRIEVVIDDSDDGYMSFVKVSDIVLSADAYVGSTITLGGSSGSMSITLEPSMIAEMDGVLVAGEFCVLTVPEANFATNLGLLPFDIVFPDAGTYFVLTPNQYVTSATFTSSIGGGSTIITLDGTQYTVDSTKLSTATDGFVAHIGTLAGEGGGLEPITFDGVVGDRVTTAGYGQTTYVKVSDAILSADDLLGAIVSLSNGNDILLISDYIMQASGGVAIAEGMMVSVAEVEAFSESISLNFSETGTYFAYPADASLYITSLTFAGGGSTGSNIKLIVNGTEYLVDSAKLSDAIAELHEALGRLSDGTV